MNRAMITIPDVEPADKEWLRRQARRHGITIEEFLRRLIRRERQRSRVFEAPSEVFKRYFGPDHGVELPGRTQFGYRPVQFAKEFGE